MTDTAEHHRRTALEEAANELELGGGSSMEADRLRTMAIERARADGRREALADVLLEIDKLGTNDLYQRAGKRIAIAVMRMIRAVNASITQA